METKQPSLIITNSNLRHLTGLTQKQRRSHLERKNWDALQNTKTVAVRPSVIDYLRENTTELLNHRMFYNPGWHTLILLISLLITGGIGMAFFSAFNALFHSTVIAGLLALPAAALLGVASAWFLSRKLFFALRRNLYSGKIQSFVNNLHPTPLGILLDEVDQFNRSVEELETRIQMTKQLKAAGHDTADVSWDRMLEVYRKTRESLVRALKTERVFRENPGMSPDTIDVAFHAFAAEEFDDQAREFTVLLDQAMEIGSRVQERIRSLSGSTNHTE